MRSLGSVLKAAVVAGLIAGAVTAVFHSLLTEPVIDRAIKMEEGMTIQARGEAPKSPVVDRTTQHRGLIVGFLVYGVTWGLLFGVLFHLTRPWHPSAWTAPKSGVVMAFLTGWAVAVLPFLKYPANPPGVGEPATIGYRQELYFGFMVLSVAGTALAVALHGFLNRPAQASPDGRAGWSMVPAIYSICAAAVFVVMPASPDPVLMPGELVRTFRTLSLVGLVVFWVVMAGVFAWLSRDEPSPALRRRGLA